MNKTNETKINDVFHKNSELTRRVYFSQFSYFGS